jgi:hypothetical protein
MVARIISLRWIVLSLVGAVLSLNITACGPKNIPVRTEISFIGVNQQPMSAALILPTSDKKAPKQYDVSCFGKLLISTVEELEQGALQACSQNFETVDLVYDKNDAIGQYDILVEISDPELNIEGECGGARAATCAFGLMGAALSKQSVNVKATIHTTIADRNGQTLLRKDYTATTSEAFGTLAGSEPHIGKAVGEALADVLHAMSRNLAASTKVRTYAQTVTLKPPVERTPRITRSDMREWHKARSGRYEDAYALVVGISRYKYANQGDLTNLIYADDDARAVAETLSELGWSESRIKLLINEQATKRNVEIAIESWLTKAGEEDLILLFWSGHGFPDPEIPEKVYFATYDTNPFVPPTGYRMDKVRAALEEHKARNVILLADTCHAGKLITRGGEKSISIVPQIEKMRREQSVPKGWIFMVGADSDRLAIENSSWTNGAFTHCLVEALSGKADGFESVGPRDGTVTMRELRAYLDSVMPDETQRVLGVAKRPVITTSTGDPNIWNLSLERK